MAYKDKHPIVLLRETTSNFFTSRGKGTQKSTCLSTGILQTPLGVLYAALEPWAQERCEPVEARRMVKGLEQLSCEKKAELELFSLKNKRSQGDVFVAFQYVA